MKNRVFMAILSYLKFKLILGNSFKQSCGSGFGIRIWDEHPGSYFRDLRNLNSLMRIRIRDTEIFFPLDPGSGMEKVRIRDPG
jgi:hypothetical protein